MDAPLRASLLHSVNELEEAFASHSHARRDAQRNFGQHQEKLRLLLQHHDHHRTSVGRSVASGTTLTLLEKDCETAHRPQAQPWSLAPDIAAMRTSTLSLQHNRAIHLLCWHLYKVWDAVVEPWYCAEVLTNFANLIASRLKALDVRLRTLQRRLSNSHRWRFVRPPTQDEDDAEAHQPLKLAHALAEVWRHVDAAGIRYPSATDTAVVGVAPLPFGDRPRRPGHVLALLLRVVPESLGFLSLLDNNASSADVKTQRRTVVEQSLATAYILAESVGSNMTEQSATSLLEMSHVIGAAVEALRRAVEYSLPDLRVRQHLTSALRVLGGACNVHAVVEACGTSPSHIMTAGRSGQLHLCGLISPITSFHRVKEAGDEAVSPLRLVLVWAALRRYRAVSSCIGLHANTDLHSLHAQHMCVLAGGHSTSESSHLLAQWRLQWRQWEQRVEVDVLHAANQPALLARLEKWRDGLLPHCVVAMDSERMELWRCCSSWSHTMPDSADGGCVKDAPPGWREMWQHPCISNVDDATFLRLLRQCLEELGTRCPLVLYALAYRVAHWHSIKA